jgi:hypothetical protein
MSPIGRPDLVVTAPHALDAVLLPHCLAGAKQADLQPFALHAQPRRPLGQGEFGQQVLHENPGDWQLAVVAQRQLDLDPVAGLDLVGTAHPPGADAVEAVTDEQPAEQKDAEQDVHRIGEQAGLDHQRDGEHQEDAEKPTHRHAFRSARSPPAPRETSIRPLVLVTRPRHHRDRHVHHDLIQHRRRGQFPQPALGLQNEPVPQHWRRHPLHVVG